MFDNGNGDDDGNDLTNIDFLLFWFYNWSWSNKMSA